MKTYKMRGLALQAGQQSWVNLSLEFEGGRAFAIWDTIRVGNYALKARLEIDPGRLKPGDNESEFVYRGELVLPNPQNN